MSESKAKLFEIQKIIFIRHVKSFGSTKENKKKVNKDALLFYCFLHFLLFVLLRLGSSLGLELQQRQFAANNAIVLQGKD